MKRQSELTFFEGTEKKIELVVGPEGKSLRERGEAWWRKIVERADANILSRISSSDCDAYLLSESSLFVWDAKVLMITCGRTRLIEAALALLDELGTDGLRMFVYERKNEVFPHEQATRFFDDVQKLAAVVPGRAYRFGDEDTHHLHLFHLDRPYVYEPEDATVEILMYGLDPAVRDRFGPQSPPDGRRLCESVGIDRILPGFRIDEHLFEPRGYSLNALRDGRYATIHVTPDALGSYASFETNARIGEDLDGLLDRVIGFFGPRSFDVIAWDRDRGAEARHGDYRVRARVERDLSCGYRVRFTSLYLPRQCVDDAVELPLHVDSADRLQPTRVLER